MSKELIRLRNICMAFDDEQVLDNINLYFNDSEFLTLLGPSGCGKTTTLRIIGRSTRCSRSMRCSRTWMCLKILPSACALLRCRRRRSVSGLRRCWAL